MYSLFQRFIVSDFSIRMILGFATMTLSAQAALIWQADFESYDTGSGAASLVLNDTGNFDTFTAASSNNLGTVSPEVRKSGVPSFMSGSALYLGGTSTGSNIAFSIKQNAITSISRGGTLGVLVVSFDVYNSSASQVSLSAEASAVSGRSGDTMYSASAAMETSYRVTIVINQSGSTVSLPGSLGNLADRGAAIYRFNGTNFEELKTSGTSLAWNTDVTGFSTGLSLSTSAVGSTYGLWLDNFGAWNSLTDTVNGTSILSLAPGTTPSNIPEPSTLALLAGISAFLVTIGIRKACA